MEALIRALAALDAPAWCDGTLALDEPVAVLLPDGDLASSEDPQFVQWLLAHGEPAPFGLGTQTVTDPEVRDATRLVARGAAKVFGFDPMSILTAIEDALSPHAHLTATLSDVVVYPPGGHFARHKDTPTTSDLIGTLIVGLPISHTGGAFTIEDDRTARFDWSGPAPVRTVRWLATFTDVDHAVEPVASGARVTLVYALHAGTQRRADAGYAHRLAALNAAIASVREPTVAWLAGTPLMVACARHVIAPDGPQPQAIDSLRGVDREVADAFVRAGWKVVVRTCLAVCEHDYDTEEHPNPPPHPLRDQSTNAYARLRQVLTPDEVDALLEYIVFDEPFEDGYEYTDDELSSLAPWIEGIAYGQRWVFRHGAAATFLRAIEFSDAHYVGNAPSSAFLYKLAALEITR